MSPVTDLTIQDLRDEYARVFGEPTRSRSKRFLEKRIAWGRQAKEHGGLSERALRRAEELANDADLRLLAPLARTVVGTLPLTHDRRLPMPGTVITREYRGRTLAVTVLTDGFEFQGERFRSLTAVAKAVTGTHWSGFHFFGLAK